MPSSVPLEKSSACVLPGAISVGLFRPATSRPRGGETLENGRPEPSKDATSPSSRLLGF